MTQYVIQVDKAEDLIVEDDQLSLDLTPGWAVFNDADGIALAIPAERIRSIQRLNDTGMEHEGGG